MAITAYTGLPGSGKSYGVTENVILPALKDGVRIWTNIPLNMELIEHEFPAQVRLFDTSDILDDPTWFEETFEAGAILVIDECWRLWPAGIKANNMEDSHKSFLAEHRHKIGSDGRSTQIVLVTQDLAQIAAYPRGLVETTYRAVKLVAVGQDNKFRIDIYTGSVTGPQPPEKAKLRSMYSSYKAEIYKYYKSQTMSETNEHGDESRTDTRTNILNSPLFKFVIPGVFVAGIVVIYFGIKAVSSMYSGDQEEADQVVVGSGPAPGVPGQPGAIEIKKPDRHRHFYEGMDAYIAFNLGTPGWESYRIAFVHDTSRVVFDAHQLGKMGYSVIGYDQCYLQLKGYGDTLHVFCQEEKDDSDKAIIDL
jgi:zona occludens toxin